MLGILFLYYIGRYFYRLAFQYDKSMWGFAILGIISYYVGTFIGAILLMIIFPYMVEDIETSRRTEFLVNLISVPFGLATTYIFYKFLERKWSRAYTVEQNDNILDDVFIEENKNNF